MAEEDERRLFLTDSSRGEGARSPTTPSPAAYFLLRGRGADEEEEEATPHDNDEVHMRSISGFGAYAPSTMPPLPAVTTNPKPLYSPSPLLARGAGRRGRAQGAGAAPRCGAVEHWELFDSVQHRGHQVCMCLTAPSSRIRTLLDTLQRTQPGDGVHGGGVRSGGRGQGALGLGHVRGDGLRTGEDWGRAIRSPRSLGTHATVHQWV